MLQRIAIQRKTTASSFDRFFQIIDRAPIAGSDRRNRLFPRPSAHRVIDLFLSSPKKIAHTQGARRLAPISGALHQLGEPVVRILVIKTLCPKVSRITKHNLSALEQEGMIVDRVGGKPSFYRQHSNRNADLIEFRAIRKS